MVWCLSTSKDGLKELLLYIARCQLQPIEYQSFFLMTLVCGHSL
jgi:hypothetical protein